MRAGKALPLHLFHLSGFKSIPSLPVVLCFSLELLALVLTKHNHWLMLIDGIDLLLEPKTRRSNHFIRSKFINWGCGEWMDYGNYQMYRWLPIMSRFSQLNENNYMFKYIYMYVYINFIKDQSVPRTNRPCVFKRLNNKKKEIKIR